MNEWMSLASAIVLAVVAGALGIFWPWIRARYTARRFHGIIARELEEIGPHPKSRSGLPWWTHLQRRFIHEEILTRPRLSENREFILTMDSTVLYLVTQLWMSYEKRDAVQWLHYLGELAENEVVGGDQLRTAHEEWKEIVTVDADPHGRSLRMRRGDLASGRSVSSVSGLFDRRADAYAKLLPLTSLDSALLSADTGYGARMERAEKLSEWLYSSEGGMVMSGSMLASFLELREALEDARATPEDLRNALSSLRTSMKIDLGVRHPDERDLPMAAPIDEAGW